MKRFAFASVAVVILLASCVDERENRVTTEPAAPRSVSTSVEIGGVASTVCAGYTKDLTAARAELQAAPEDVDLQAKVGSLDAMIADACQ